MSFFNIYGSLPRSSLASFDSIIPPKLHRRVMRAISMGPNLHEKKSLLTWEIAIDFIPKHPNARLSILLSCQCIVNPAFISGYPSLISMCHPPSPGSLIPVFNQYLLHYQYIISKLSSTSQVPTLTSQFLGTTPPLHYMLTSTDI